MICELENENVIPPGGFDHITEDDNAITIEGSSLRDLTNRVRTYYETQGVKPEGDIRDLVVCQLCARLPKGWCRNTSEGLGDTVFKVLKAAGIHGAVKRYAQKRGKGCGCGGRQVALNKAFPYRTKRST